MPIDIGQKAALLERGDIAALLERGGKMVYDTRRLWLCQSGAASDIRLHLAA